MQGISEKKSTLNDDENDDDDDDIIISFNIYAWTMRKIMIKDWSWYRADRSSSWSRHISKTPCISFNFNTKRASGREKNIFIFSEAIFFVGFEENVFLYFSTKRASDKERNWAQGLFLLQETCITSILATPAL